MKIESRILYDGYIESQCIRLGGMEVIIFEKHTNKAKYDYLVCDCSWDNPLSVDMFANKYASNDYLEVIGEFQNRIAEQVRTLHAERAERDITDTLQYDVCIPDSEKSNYAGQVIIIRPNALSPEYRYADYQLYYATSGNGCNPEGHGQKVYCRNLYTHDKACFRRTQVLGVIETDKMPGWAKIKLLQLYVELEQEKHRPQPQPSKEKTAPDAPER